ncbi:hypothetical protein [Polaromonas naphthalenivorans]|uniref:Uncharacterized protein n=1 Tax=Polaromonas naphthalenivorans (strain CJ2) TaxID=365044 RepID=A1VKV5_POLNA|nr:hypothetical protein [Polaromonas naphthalenivorans]ABM36283.1 hypothetical protein Pnap_0966 [Polaromonas naphthalenivorans CJ2]
MENTPVTPVMGYLAQNWINLNARTPAVILNPEASPLDLMAWCWAELRSMQAAANALVGGIDDIDKGDFSALIIHRIEPLANVFQQAMSQLHRDSVQSGRV